MDFRPSEELYDLKEDPFELNNLALNPKYSEELSHYSQILKNWIIETDDKGQFPEKIRSLKINVGNMG
ncbi:hypothetical protein ALGA_0397 [Labilibaculum antarcticum]|uniref:N-sulphoglucosamine sulphohydrolase C-terminal domain-containing protein n=1 Tax=Labilibaculum antarcticum TaxID=1717717 RepID=A0A1Y1CHM5_9BACT|nr:hypothetical protein ALGA_0397 [Labilibaculum antarcticum]